MGRLVRGHGLILVLALLCIPAGWSRAQVAAPDAAQPDSTRPAGEKSRPVRTARPARSKASAPRRARAREVGPFSITGSVDLQTIYDDNIFRYSQANIDRFRQGDYKPGEFDLETYDDLIFSPRLNLNLGFSLLGGQPSSLRLSYTRWQYLKNADKSNEAWSARLRQPAGTGDFFELGYAYAPLSFIRPLGDRAPFGEPYSTTPYSYHPFKMVRNTFLLAYQRKLLDRLSLRLEGNRILRFYNQRFIENDNWEWNGAGTATLNLTSTWRTIGRYAYGSIRARGLDTVGETRATSNDSDPSYNRGLYGLTFEWVPRGGFGYLTVWDVGGNLQVYRYTSQKPYWEDPTHVGRKDNVTTFETTVGTRRFWGQVTGELGYRYSRRKSSSGAGSDLEEDKNYRDQRFWLGASYPF